MNQNFKTIEEYRNYLFSTDTSLNLISYMSQNLLLEVNLMLQCVFSRIPINIPIRHKNLGNINCIFDLDIWLSFFEDSLKNGIEQNFICSGCRKYVIFSDFGVDYTLYQVLAQKQLLEKINQIKLQKDKLIFSLQNVIHEYYGILSNDKSIKILLPGCNALIKSRRQNDTFQITNKQQDEIYDQINDTINKIQRYIANKVYQSNLKGVDLSEINQKLLKTKPIIKQKFKEIFNLIQLGQKSLKNRIVFGFKKLITNGKNNGSVLVIYYPHYNIWKDYEIMTTEENHFQYEQALYIKDESHKDEIKIYIIGGRINYLIQTDQFVQIIIPKDPFNESKNVQINYLPKFPHQGYNFLGGVYEDKVFVFCGQKRQINENNQIQDEILNSAFVYQDQQWIKLNEIVENRYDGSQILFNDPKLGEMIMLFGGTSKIPEGQMACAIQEQQHICQIFSFKQRQFIGNGLKLKFSDNPEDDYQKYILSNPVYSIPYDDDKFLIISGNFLKYKCFGINEIFMINIKDGTIKLNEFQSTSLMEYQLLTYLKKSHRNKCGIDFFQPIQDFQGINLHENYITLFQEEIWKDSSQVKVKISAFQYSTANGIYLKLPYLRNETSIKLAKDYLNELNDSENKIL